MDVLGELNHWHPILGSHRLRRRPVPVRLCGLDLVLFRDGAGVPAALHDRCAHRAMRLSRGRVQDGRLACPYHGWSYDRAGVGSCPNSPDMAFEVPVLEVEERAGLVWVKAKGEEAPFPELDFDDYRLVCTLRRRFAAPLEPVIDNFADDEHTAVVHGVFGYAPDRMPEVTLRVDSTDDTVSSSCVGPHKRVPRLLAPIFGIYGGDRFTIDWTFHFSPLHCVFDMSWTDPSSGQPRGFKDRVDVFFLPIDDTQTELVYRQFTTMAMLGDPGFHLLVRPLTTLITEMEVRLDQRIMANLADTSGDLSTMRLGRLDKSLALVRHRLDGVYRRRPAGGDRGRVAAVQLRERTDTVAL